MGDLRTAWRTHTCGALRKEAVGSVVRLVGWVHSIRQLGALLFIDLRDRFGRTQLLFQAPLNKRAVVLSLNREYVIAVSGTVVLRSNPNPDNPTGAIEIAVEKITVLNTSLLPPFTIQEQTDGGEHLRMQYRYLDLRRPNLQRYLMLRHQTVQAVRDYLNTHSFLDIETPFLIKSTPEGARDFVVPSRMNPGLFYALPQSPQMFKQLLMVSGYDRYYQIVRCFRDEDLRADRQPEFTQIDCELCFVDREDVLRIFEGMIKYVVQTVKGVDLPDFKRMSWQEAMDNYGSDKPDIRFNLRLCAVSDLLIRPETPFSEDAYAVAIVVPQSAHYSRKQLDALTELAQSEAYGMRFVSYIKYHSETDIRSSFDKHTTFKRLQEIGRRAGAAVGDLALIFSGKDKIKVQKAMGLLRLEMGERLGLRKAETLAFVWVLDFPMFAWDEDARRYYAVHHPFTAPLSEDRPLLQAGGSDLRSVRADAYDMVLNGVEIGGGSIRIYEASLQAEAFKILGLSEAEIKKQFGFLLEAFAYGAPPHGGIAFGLDRLCALLGGQEQIRDFIAFPKNNQGKDVMLSAPSVLSAAQLQELAIDVRMANGGC